MQIPLTITTKGKKPEGPAKMRMEEIISVVVENLISATLLFTLTSRLNIKERYSAVYS